LTINVVEEHSYIIIIFTNYAGYSMNILKTPKIYAILIWLVASIAYQSNALAEADEIRIAQQWGIGYLPMAVIKSQGLLEKNIKLTGLGTTKITWAKFAGGSNMNDALLSNSLDIATGGIPPFITLWSRTSGDNQVKIAAVMSQMPLYLNTNDPNIKTIKDFTEKDKIAMPAIRTSNQAVLLAIATKKQLGSEHVEKINRLTVSMAHPDATLALINNNISASFSAPPFQYQQLRDPRVRTILTSKEIMGGPFTFTASWTTVKFRKNNPKLYEAFVISMSEAINFIRNNKRSAAEIYIKESKSTESIDELMEILSSPDVEFTNTPKAVMAYSEFVFQLGLIKRKPDKWQDMFFDNVHQYSGN
jgi:NitT/TauT family transport system substrate-binding protein